ncbi:hypothetical protein Val02_53540 [Virgisporangium aliadipatigenens]|uniref:YncI copper-binding domain-containing protein n=2 Tax=Virgisporangium aliadipatigenens TaxID=741659 RepID=A0A8J3YQH3_9ACTN|nr:hypothetical protein Val02_53540 [Virgisporangium aliadipatigenens]
MRFARNGVRTIGLVGLGLLCLGLAATPATAAPLPTQVTVGGDTPVQGDAAKLTFTITNEHPTSPINSVQILIPEANPIAEVFPLSVDGWAPAIAMRPIDQPIPGLHGPLPIKEVVTTVTWSAFEGAALAPGGTLKLTLSMGPIPLVSTMTFAVVETHADGSTVRWADGGDKPALSLAVNPAIAQPEAATDAAPAPAKESDSGRWWLYGALVFIAAVTAFGVLRQKRAKPAVEPARVTIAKPAPTRGRELVKAGSGESEN